MSAILEKLLTYGVTLLIVYVTFQLLPLGSEVGMI
jgi:hypothetical protein